MLLTLLSLLGCNTVGFDAVSIAPIYGFVDGCNAILVSGHGFEDDVAARIGDNDITDLVLPEENTENPAANARGYQFTGRVPASSVGTGYQDVTVYQGDKSDTISGSGAYYYVACPQTGLLSEVTWTSADGNLTAGTKVEILGCNLTSEVFAQIVDTTDTPVGGAIPLSYDCGTGMASFTAPAVPAAGTYYLKLTSGDGATVYSGLAGDYCSLAGDTGSTYYSTSYTSSSSSSSSSSSTTDSGTTTTTTTTGGGDTSATTVAETGGGVTPGIDSSVPRDTAYGGTAYGCFALPYGGAE